MSEMTTEKVGINRSTVAVASRSDVDGVVVFSLFASLCDVWWKDGRPCCGSFVSNIPNKRSPVPAKVYEKASTRASPFLLLRFPWCLLQLTWRKARPAQSHLELKQGMICMYWNDDLILRTNVQHHTLREFDVNEPRSNSPSNLIQKLFTVTEMVTS